MAKRNRRPVLGMGSDFLAQLQATEDARRDVVVDYVNFDHLGRPIRRQPPVMGSASVFAPVAEMVESRLSGIRS